MQHSGSCMQMFYCIIKPQRREFSTYSIYVAHFLFYRRVETTYDGELNEEKKKILVCKDHFQLVLFYKKIMKMFCFFSIFAQFRMCVLLALSVSLVISTIFIQFFCQKVASKDTVPNLKFSTKTMLQYSIYAYIYVIKTVYLGGFVGHELHVYYIKCQILELMFFSQKKI